MKSIFDIAEEKFSIKENINQIISAFTKEKYVTVKSALDILDGFDYDMTFEQYIDKHNFKNWEYKSFSLSINDYKKKVNIDNISTDSNEEQLIHYLEFVYNMLNIFDENCYYDKVALDAILDLIERLLSKLNYKIVEVKKTKYKVIINNSSLPTVINKVSKDIQSCFIEYLIIDNKIEDKRKILKLLADYFEGEKKNYKDSNVDFIKSLYNDTTYYFNNYNIRHNNLNGNNKKEKLLSMTDEKLEHIYDMIYNNCLLLILLKEYAIFHIETKQNKIDIPAK